MKLVSVTCRSLSPLLMNPMTDDTLEELRTGVRKPPQRDKLARDVAVERLYREGGDPEGLIGIPGINVYASMIEAARNFSIKMPGATKPRQISTGDSSLLPGLVLVREEFLPFPEDLQSEEAWKTDKRRGRLKDGTAVCIVRPKFDQWAFTMTLEVQDKQINDAMVQAIITMAGRSVGVGDFRPSCRGVFGRFQIKSWKVLEVMQDEFEGLDAAA